jgi:hypothetical protein
MYLPGFEVGASVYLETEFTRFKLVSYTMHDLYIVTTPCSTCSGIVSYVMEI